MRNHRLRRCCLSVPGSREDMLEKARQLEIDQIVIDWEDAVAPDQKLRARDVTLAALASPWRASSVSVRINGVETPHCLNDVLAITQKRSGQGQTVESVVLPKTASTSQIHFVSTLLDQLGVDDDPMAPSHIEALIEDADGMIYVHAIALASPRLESLIFGMGDFAAAQGIQTTVIGDQSSYDADLWHYPRYRLIMAARAANIAAIDGPFAAFKDVDGLNRDCSVARLMGMNGKWAIHPGQTEAIAAHFTPSQLQIDQARKQKTAFEEALKQGQGAVAVDGAMVDQASINLLEPLLADAKLLGM